jgi:hypothetical protein
VYIERFQDTKGDLFLKFPLISNLLNDRQWRVRPQANEECVHTAIGKPLTVMLNKEESLFHDGHPFSLKSAATNQDHVEFANKYAIGEIVDVTRDSGKYKAAAGEIPWFGIAKITDPVAKEELQKPESRLIPPGFSPGIIQLEGPDHDISKYEIVHVASVAAGAYGPKFVSVAKCNGDLTTCAPQLRAAALIVPHKDELVNYNYKEKTGCCPLDAFSSLLLKSASTDHNMSLNASNAMTPGPGTFSSQIGQEIRGPEGNILGQSTAPKPKPTIKIRRLYSQSTEPSQEEEQELGPNNNNNNEEQGEQPTSDANADAMFRKSSYYKELQDLKGKYKQQSEQWAYKEKRNEIEKIIPKRLFTVTDKSGTSRFRQKDWENEVERAIKENVPISFLQEYYATKEQLMEVPEIKRASSVYSNSNPGTIPMLKGASSLESDEERIKAEKALRLNGGF